MERRELDWVGRAEEADAEVVIVDSTAALLIGLINNFLAAEDVSTSTALKGQLSD